VFGFLPDVTLQQFLQRTVAIAFVVTVHGVVATMLLRWRGDDGPWMDGRAGPNPVSHLDIVGYVTAVFTAVGWSKALDHDARRLARPLLDAVFITTASAVALWLLAFGALSLRPLVIGGVPGDAGVTLSLLLTAMADVALLAGIVSLLPFPPFLGGLMLQAALRTSSRATELVTNQSLRTAIGIVASVVLIAGWADSPLRSVARVLATSFR
jgi:Zn-dependent protease